MTEITESSKIIEGLTAEGDKFRPSDWAERLCGSLSEFRQRRIHYNPRLKPFRNKAAIKCIFLDGSLASDMPALYRSVLDFANINHLRVHDYVPKDHPENNDTTTG